MQRISLFILCCFLSMLISESYPLYAASEQDGVALIVKGEAEYSNGLYQQALDSLGRALAIVQDSANRERLLLDIALVNFAMGSNDKCAEALGMLLGENPEKRIDRENFP